MADLYEVTARVILTMGPCVLVAGCFGEHFAILPGGHVEDDDAHALEGLRREVQEEVGVVLATIRKLTVLANQWTRGEDLVHEKMHLYAGTVNGAYPGDLRGGALLWSPEAKTVLRWASINDIVTRAVQLQPPALLPWVVQCLGRRG